MFCTSTAINISFVLLQFTELVKTAKKTNNLCWGGEAKNCNLKKILTYQQKPQLKKKAIIKFCIISYNTYCMPKVTGSHYIYLAFLVEHHPRMVVQLLHCIGFHHKQI